MGRRIPWTEMAANKERYIGGQITQFDEGSGVGVIRGEIADIQVDAEGYVKITTSWNAWRESVGKPWEVEDRTILYGGIKDWVGMPEEQRDGSLTFGITMIRGDIDIYPKGHPSNIRQEDRIEDAAAV